MIKLIRPALVVMLTLGVAACASPPPPQIEEFPQAPEKRCVDVKMDLDTHRNCR